MLRDEKEDPCRDASKLHTSRKRKSAKELDVEYDQAVTVTWLIIQPPAPISVGVPPNTNFSAVSP